MRVNRWVIVALICVSLVAILGAIKFTQIRAAIAFGNSFPEPSETVAAVTASFSNWQPSISVIGEVRASREVVVQTEVAGVIAKVGFASAAQVRQGQMLLQLDIAEESAQLEMIRPEVELAKIEVDRLTPLVAKNAVSRQLFDQAQANLAIARARLLSIQEIIAKKTVLAPFSGTVGIHQFEVGQVLDSNVVVTQLVGELEQLWVDFFLPQKFANLAVGTTVTVSATDIIDQTLTGRVIAVEPIVSRQSRSVRARASLENASGELKPGLIVQVNALVGAARQVVRLPNTAVRRDAFGNFVFALQKDADGGWRAHRKPIKVISSDSRDAIVTAGVEVGDMIAATGSFKLREGLLVKVSNIKPNEPLPRQAEQARSAAANETGSANPQNETKLNHD